jgi:CheY-like chemotaxis protein
MDRKNIMIVEDNDISFLFTRFVLKDAGIDGELNTYSNGEEAIEYLKECEEDSFPDLIFLDLYMPVMDGFEFLEELGRHKGLKAIPVAVLTNAIFGKKEEQKLKSYNVNVIGIYEKPLTEEAVRQIVKNIF